MSGIKDAVPFVFKLRDGAAKAREVLLRLKEQYPDSASFIDEQIAELDEYSAEIDTVIGNLSDPNFVAALAVTLVNELKALPAVGLAGTHHPGSTTGG